jgi:hypothetical protein
MDCDCFDHSTVDYSKVAVLALWHGNLAMADPKVVADQLGHTLDVKLNVYTQTSLENRLRAVETLEASLVN